VVVALAELAAAADDAAMGVLLARTTTDSAPAVDSVHTTGGEPPVQPGDGAWVQVNHGRVAGGGHAGVDDPAIGSITAVGHATLNQRRYARLDGAGR
jgi:hypothetical protein